MANKLLSLFLLGFVFFHNGTSAELVTKVNGMSEQSCLFESGEELAELLYIFMEQSEIIQILGADYVEGTSMMTNEKTWRYDLCSVETYENDRNDDIVDLEALANDQIKYIVFLNFSGPNEALSHISIYYKDNQGQLHEYMQFADGTIKNIIID